MSPRLVWLLLLAAYPAWVLGHWAPVCVGPDAVGLCEQARHFARSGFEAFRPESPAELIGSHWVETESGVFRGRYPPGYPMLLGVAERLVGPGGSLLLGPLLGVLAGSILFAVGLQFAEGDRTGSRTGAFLATLTFATLSLLNRLVLHGDTHVPATVCILAGIWLLIEWDRRPTPPRAFFAGMAWGILPTIRYGEAMISLAAFGFMALRTLRRPGPGRSHPGAALAGALIPLTLLATYHTVAFGSPWRTGYALTNEQTAFTLRSIRGNLSFYFSGLVEQPDVGIYVALGCLALGFMIRDREGRALGLFLAAAVLLSVLEYSSYYWGDMETAPLALRFFLPATACLGVATAWLASRAEGRGRWILASGLSGLVFLGVIRSAAAMRDEGLALDGAGTVVAAARQEVPTGSVLISPRVLGETLSYTGAWHISPQWLFPGDPEREAIIVPWEVPPELVRESSESDSPRTVQVNRGASLRSHYRGLREEALLRTVLADIREWQPAAEVYWIGDPRVVEIVNGFLREEAFIPLGEVILPRGPQGPTLAPPPYWVPRPPLFLFRLGPSQG